MDPVKFPMEGTGSCYREGCPGEMFGADAPAHTWQMTFLHANLANPAPGFVMADIPGELWSMGTGVNNPAPPKKPGKGGNGPATGTAGNGPGNGNGPGGGRRQRRRAALSLAARLPEPGSGAGGGPLERILRV